MVQSEHAVKRRVISHQNLPTRLPVWPTATIILIYDRFPPHELWEEIAWGVIIVSLILKWMFSLITIGREKQVDIMVGLDVIIKKITVDEISKNYGELFKKKRT